jgi:hypothetical protein
LAQIFISHSKLDVPIRSFFASAFGRTNVRAVFVEYESLDPPPWEQIQKLILESAAVFVLLGTNADALVHTATWIGSEATVAANLSRDVWVFEHGDEICSSLPILSAKHYLLYRFNTEFEDYIKQVVESYDDLPILQATLTGAFDGMALTAHLPQPGAQQGGAIVGAFMASLHAARLRATPPGLLIQCPYPNCGHQVYCHNSFVNGLTVLCPACRRLMTFPPPSPVNA